MARLAPDRTQLQILNNQSNKPNNSKNPDSKSAQLYYAVYFDSVRILRVTFPSDPTGNPKDNSCVPYGHSRKSKREKSTPTNN